VQYTHTTLSDLNPIHVIRLEAGFTICARGRRENPTPMAWIAAKHPVSPPDGGVSRGRRPKYSDRHSRKWLKPGKPMEFKALKTDFCADESRKAP